MNELTIFDYLSHPAAINVLGATPTSSTTAPPPANQFSNLFAKPTDPVTAAAKPSTPAATTAVPGGGLFANFGAGNAVPKTDATKPGESAPASGAADKGKGKDPAETSGAAAPTTGLGGTAAGTGTTGAAAAPLFGGGIFGKKPEDAKPAGESSIVDTQMTSLRKTGSSSLIFTTE